MIEQRQQNEANARIEELEPQEALEVGGGLNVFDDLYAYLKGTPRED